MKHCPVKYRPLVADLIDGKIAPAGRKILLKELRKNPKFADELAALYGDHLAMAVNASPNRTDDILKEVYSVTRWSGESREIARSIEQSEDGSERIINETISVTRWAGQSAQFIRDVEQALIPHKEQKERRKSWRRIIYYSAVGCFAALCILAVFNTVTPGDSTSPTFLPGENPAGIKVIRKGFTYGVSDELHIEPADVIRTGSSSTAQLGFPDGSIIALNPASELRIPSNRSEIDQIPKLNTGQIEIAAITAPPNTPSFKLRTPDALLSQLSGDLSVAIRNGGTLVRVLDGRAHIASTDTNSVQSITLTKNQEMTTAGNRAFEVRQTDVIDDHWIADLNPVLWLDAASWESVVLDKNGRVEKWLDRSKKRTLFSQSSSPDRPRLLEREMNGRDAIYFASPKQLLSGIRRVEACTIIAVCRFQGVIPNLGGLFGSLGDFGIRHTGKNSWQGQEGTSANTGDFGGGRHAKTWVNGSHSGNAGSGVPHVLSIVRLTPASFEKPTIGSYFRHPGYGPGSRPFHGVVCELLIFHVPLSDERRTNIENHLKTKWGI